MSSCMSGGSGRTLGFDLEIVISSSTSSRNSHHSSSPSSTISESCNSPLAISTRKPRTPRKRPNQTYNEAATLLSTAYPNIFPTKHLTKQYRSTNSHDSVFQESPSELLFHHQPITEDPSFRMEPKVFDSREKPGENDSQVNSMDCCNEFEDDFDAESILDEEIEEGIDSIMGNLSVNNNFNINESNYNFNSHPMGLGLGLGGKFQNGFGFRFGFGFIPRGVRAFRQVDDGDWWRFPTVDVLEISPKLNRICATDKKKKKVKRPEELMHSAGQSELISIPKLELELESESRSMILKLDHKKVMSSWSDRGSPFWEETSELSSGNDGYARLAQIDLFSEGGGIREASVLRYKEKRRTRLFSKKIRYQVRKVNADRRPRMKGRFVRRPNTTGSSQR